MVTKQWRMADRHRRIHAALGVLLAGAATLPAHAQTLSEPVNELAFTAELRHDSNVARSDEARATQRGLEQSDQRLSVGASLLLARPLGRNSVSVDAYLGYDFYRRNTRLNRERIAVSGDLDVNVGPCLVSFTPRFNRQQSELYDLAVLDVPGVDSIRNTETTQSYRGELRCGRPGGIRPLAYYERNFGDNSNTIRQTSDYRGETFGGGLSYSNPVLGDFDLSLERENLKYPNRPVTLGLTGYRQDQVKLAVSRHIGAVLSADGYIAYTHLKSRDSGVEGFKGIAWSLGLTAIPLPDLRLRANLAQSLRPSLGSTALFVRNRDWGLEATYQVGPKTSVSLGGNRRERFYRGAASVFGPLLERERLDTYTARIDFHPSPRLSIGLAGGHERRNANGTFYDYDSTFVALNTRFTLGSI